MIPLLGEIAESDAGRTSQLEGKVLLPCERIPEMGYTGPGNRISDDTRLTARISQTTET